MWGCLLCTPHLEPGQQPRHVPWLGVKPAALWSRDQCSIHWTTPSLAYLLTFRERGRAGEGEGKNINVPEIHQWVASHMPLAGELAHNPGTCPDRESNQQTFSSQSDNKYIEPHQPGLIFTILKSQNLFTVLC